MSHSLINSPPPVQQSLESKYEIEIHPRGNICLTYTHTHTHRFKFYTSNEKMLTEKSKISFEIKNIGKYRVAYCTSNIAEYHFIAIILSIMLEL